MGFSFPFPFPFPKSMTSQQDNMGFFSCNQKEHLIRATFTNILPQIHKRSYNYFINLIFLNLNLILIILHLLKLKLKIFNNMKRLDNVKNNCFLNILLVEMS